MNKPFKQALIVGPIAGTIALLTVGAISLKQLEAQQHKKVCADLNNRVQMLRGLPLSGDAEVNKELAITDLHLQMRDKKCYF